MVDETPPPNVEWGLEVPQENIHLFLNCIKLLCVRFVHLSSYHKIGKIDNIVHVDQKVARLFNIGSIALERFNSH